MSSFLQSSRILLLHKGLNTVPTVLFAGTSLIAVYLYLKTLNMKIPQRTTVICTYLFLFITFFSYPILSTDIFSYIMTSRVATVHNSNIWKVSPNNFQNDPFLKLSDWKTIPGIYGFVDQSFYNGVSYISRNSLLMNIILNKILVIIFAVFTFFVLRKILTKFYSDTELYGIRFIFWNPLFLLEIAGSGHNDILMIFFMLLAYYLFLSKRYFMFGIAIALSVQTKVIPIFLLIFIIGKLLKEKKLKEIVSLTIPFVIINAICFYAMQISPLQYIQRLQYNTNINWQSLQALLARVGIEYHGIFTTIFIVSIVLALVLQFFKKINPLAVYTAVMFFYLLFIASAYWNWYVLWVLVFLPFVNNKRLMILGLVLSFTSLFAYPIYWTSLRFGYQNIAWAVLIYLFIFVVPIVAFYIKKPNITILLDQNTDNKL